MTSEGRKGWGGANGSGRCGSVHRLAKTFLRRPSTLGTFSCTYSRSKRCLLSFCYRGMIQLLESRKKYQGTGGVPSLKDHQFSSPSQGSPSLAPCSEAQ